MISKKTIEEVFNVAVIEDVIGDFVGLKKAGANFKGLSPFSDEKTPSFIVSPSKRIWKDFSSGKGGNVVSFLMEHDGCSYPEAIRYLAKKYNVEIIETQDKTFNQKDEDDKESISILLDFVQKKSKDYLINNENILKYLSERKLDKTIIEKFDLGYLPKGSKEFYDKLIKKGFKKEILIKSGLFLEGDNIYSRFNERILFPIYSISSRIIGFGGRVLNNDKKTAKYINSPETLLYQKSKVLYGLNFAKTEIIKNENCYLVEGYLDVISLHQKKITNVVASSGTAITSDQIRLIKRFSNSITILFDSDQAGINAALRVIDIALSSNMYVNVIKLPDGHDPDSFAKTMDHTTLKNFLQDKKQDFLSFISNIDSENLEIPEKKIKLVKKLLHSISLVNDVTNQAIYIEKASKILNLDAKILFQDLINRNKKHQEREEKKIIEKQEINPPSKEEQFLFKLLLNHGEKYIQINADQKVQVAKMIIQELQLDGITIEHPTFIKILGEYQDALKKGKIIEKEFFINHMNLEVAKITAYLISEKYKIDNWEKKNIKVQKEEDILFSLIKEALIRFKLKRISDITKEILERIPSIINDEEKKMELNRFSKLMNLSRNLHKQVGREC